MELYKEAYLLDNLSRTLDNTEVAEFMENVPTTQTINTNTDEWFTKTVYPNRLNRKWGQGHPYNMYCFTEDSLKALAGCLPVALAQVLTYYDYPATINGYKIDWKYLHFDYPTNINNAQQSARLIHEVGVLTGAEYGVNGTGASVNKMKYRLTEWGYSYREASPFHEIMMIHNLYEFGPALVYGASFDKATQKIISAHEWVIDGAIAQSNNKTHRFLYHCNWGWDGSKNGYFLATAFDPYNGAYAPNYQFNYATSFIGFLEKPE